MKKEKVSNERGEHIKRIKQFINTLEETEKNNGEIKSLRSLVLDCRISSMTGTKMINLGFLTRVPGGKPAYNFNIDQKPINEIIETLIETKSTSRKSNKKNKNQTTLFKEGIKKKISVNSLRVINEIRKTINSGGKMEDVITEENSLVIEKLEKFNLLGGNETYGYNTTVILELNDKEKREFAEKIDISIIEDQKRMELWLESKSLDDKYEKTSKITSDKTDFIEKVLFPYLEKLGEKEEVTPENLLKLSKNNKYKGGEFLFNWLLMLKLIETVDGSKYFENIKNNSDNINLNRDINTLARYVHYSTKKRDDDKKALRLKKEKEDAAAAAIKEAAAAAAIKEAAARKTSEEETSEEETVSYSPDLEPTKKKSPDLSDLLEKKQNSFKPQTEVENKLSTNNNLRVISKQFHHQNINRKRETLESIGRITTTTCSLDDNGINRLESLLKIVDIPEVSKKIDKIIEEFSLQEKK